MQMIRTYLNHNVN